MLVGESPLGVCGSDGWANHGYRANEKAPHARVTAAATLLSGLALCLSTTTSGGRGDETIHIATARTV